MVMQIMRMIARIPVSNTTENHYNFVVAQQLVFSIAKLVYKQPLSVSQSVNKMENILWQQFLLNGWMDYVKTFRKFLFV